MFTCYSPSILILKVLLVPREPQPHRMHRGEEIRRSIQVYLCVCTSTLQTSCVLHVYINVHFVQGDGIAVACVSHQLIIDAKACNSAGIEKLLDVSITGFRKHHLMQFSVFVLVLILSGDSLPPKENLHDKLSASVPRLSTIFSAVASRLSMLVPDFVAIDP